MKKLLLTTCICLAGLAYSQDQLFKKDNSKIEAKILEINQTEIKYKLFNYQDGPTIIISKNDVAMIIYQNGTHEVFNTKAEMPISSPNVVIVNKNNSVETEKKMEEEKLAKFNDLVSTKNLISLNFLEPMNGTFSMNYLREFANNLFNVYVPVGVGFAQPYFSQLFVSSYNSANQYNSSYVTDFKFSRKSFETGISLHFQTSGKRAVTHFIGPYFGVSQYNGTFIESNYYNYDPYIYHPNTKTEHGFVMNRYQIMLDNGFLFRATKNFNIVLLGAVGYYVDDFIANNPSKFTGNTYYRNSSLPVNSFKLGLSMGYRF